VRSIRNNECHCTHNCAMLTSPVCPANLPQPASDRSFMSRGAGDGVGKTRARGHRSARPPADGRRCVAGLSYARPATRILLVDDGSTSGRIGSGDPRLLADPRVTLLRHPENRGVAAARNTALA
jgi:hypothetical protein